MKLFMGTKIHFKKSLNQQKACTFLERLHIFDFDSCFD